MQYRYNAFVRVLATDGDYQGFIIVGPGDHPEQTVMTGDPVADYREVMRIGRERVKGHPGVSIMLSSDINHIHTELPGLTWAVEEGVGDVLIPAPRLGEDTYYRVIYSPLDGSPGKKVAFGRLIEDREDAYVFRRVTETGEDYVTDDPNFGFMVLGVLPKDPSLVRLEPMVLDRTTGSLRVQD